MLILIFLQIVILKHFNYNNEYIISFIGIFILVSLKLIPQIIYLFSLFNKMKQSQIATNQFLEEYTKIENEIINKDKIINYKNEIQFQDISFKVQ